MFKLLNKFAWVISIILWYAMSLSLFLMMFWKVREEGIVISMIIWLIFWYIIKKIMFSDNYIRERLQFFADQISKNYINTDTWLSVVNKVEVNNSINEKKNNIQTIQDEYEEKHTQEFFDKKIKEIEQEKKQTTNVVNENINPVKKEVYVHEPSAFEEWLNALWTYIKEFFSTNLLAKLWAILVFLAVVYFLKWAALAMWDIIWPVWRIFIWILAWFVTYSFWMNIYKNSKKEWIILMWTWILINFAVILWGRYLVWGDWYLTETTTFLFLILNTVLAIVTSLVFKSRTLLLFSFVFAYFNPFIIWAESNWQPYTLIIYSMVISVWALFLSKKQSDLALLIISFIAWNLLFLVAPFVDSIGWITKIIFTVFLSLWTIILSNTISKKDTDNNWVLYTFLWTYLFVVLHLLNSSWALADTFSFLVYYVILLSLFAFTIRLILTIKTWVSAVGILLFVPLIIIIWILVTGNLIFLPFVLLWTIISYMIWFIFLVSTLSSIFIYLFYGVLSIFIFIFWIALQFKWLEFSVSSPIEFITVLFTTFIFMIFSYYYSTKKNLTNLYPVWTFWTALIIMPLIVNTYFIEKWKLPLYIDLLTNIPNPSSLDLLFLFKLSILSIIVFAISNWIMPFINKNLLDKKNFTNLITWVLIWVLFLGFQIYNFWVVHFPWVTMWFAFLALAIAYFLQSIILVNKLWIENVKKDNNLKNAFYSFAWISISLFSIAVAFVFSAYPEIISATWLFEATLLYYFYSKTLSWKLFTFATVLFAIWLTKFWVLIDLVERGDFMFLISFIIILASFILNLKFLDSKKDNNELSIIHNIGHIIWMIIMGVLLLIIIPSTGHGWSMLWISSFIFILWMFYAKFNFHLLKVVFLFVVAWFWILHIWSVNDIFFKLKIDDLLYLKPLQYIVAWIVVWNLFVWNKFSLEKWYNKILVVIVWIYAFLISNVFIYNIFENLLGHLSLTLYWGLIASVLLTYWIQKDVIKKRTIWLYFLILTSIKIFFFDVWQLWNTNEIVFAFMVLWVIFIIISTMYTKKYWDNLLWELSFSNLGYWDKDIDSSNSNEDAKNNENITSVNNEELHSVNKKIKDIDVSEFKSVKFKINNWEIIQIRTLNLLRISKLIIVSNNKNVFKEWELAKTYEFIVKNYKTDLTKNNYDKILKIIGEFVEKGWEVELIKK